MLYSVFYQTTLGNPFMCWHVFWDEEEAKQEALNLVRWRIALSVKIEKEECYDNE